MSSQPIARATSGGEFTDMVHAIIEYDGEPDIAYLRDALARARIDTSVGELRLEQLTGGRSAASVDKLLTDAGSFVLKRISKESWLTAALKSPGEGRLWLSGALDGDALPAALRCPTIDVVYHAPSEAWWLLMDDVGDAIAERGQFGEAETRTLWSAMARQYANYWNKTEKLAALPVAPLVDTTSVIAEPSFGAVSKQFREPWVEDVTREFMPLRVLMPMFLELLSAADAEFYLAMLRDRSWHDGLEQGSATFLHGDLRRANISFQADATVLFDWELASVGPPACDLQWNSFLTFWAYTPEDGKQAWERDHLKDYFLAQLDEALGEPIDREEFEKTWNLAWLRVMSQLAFCFADANLDDAEERKSVKQRINVAIERCRRTLGG